MNKYIYALLACALILITASVVMTKTGVGESQVSSAISVSEDSYDFGEIDIFGGDVQTTYTLVNEGTDDVRITSGVTSCMCTTGQIDNFVFGMHQSTGQEVVIPAGGEKALVATFDPLAHGPEGTGKIKRELFLKTNSQVTPELRVTFSGNVIKEE